MRRRARVRGWGGRNGREGDWEKENERTEGEKMRKRIREREVGERWKEEVAGEERVEKKGKRGKWKTGGEGEKHEGNVKRGKSIRRNSSHRRTVSGLQHQNVHSFLN